MKTYAGADKLPYMDSSIDLGQDDVRRVLVPKQILHEHSPIRFRERAVQGARDYSEDAFGAT